MSMHPFTEGNLAACRRHMEEVNALLEKAIVDGGEDAWAHIISARTRLLFALGELQAASALEKMQAEMAVTAGGGE